MKTVRKIKPMGRRIVTTKMLFGDKLRNGLFRPSNNGSIDIIQQVIAVGPHVREINVGDYVCINPKNYIKVKHTLQEELTDKPEMEINVNYPTVELEDGTYLLLWEDDVDYVIEEFGDDIEPETKIMVDGPQIIIP